MPKNCENCKYENNFMNEWPCNKCDDLGYGPNMWEAKDYDNKEKKNEQKTKS